jgi:hypothetical protein
MSAEPATLREPDLEAATQHHRRELHVHCYRGPVADTRLIPAVRPPRARPPTRRGPE